jgi:hypothetical protein
MSSSPLAGVDALRRAGLARNRGAGADAAAADALAEPGAPRRDPKTGRILGNLYVLHDEPLTPSRRCSSTRLPAAGQPGLGHSAKAVQIVGLHTLKEIAEDPLLRPHLPSRLQVLAERLARQGIGAHESYPQEEPPRFRRRGDEPSSEWRTPLFGIRSRAETRARRSLRNPKQDRTVRSSRINEVRTTARERGQARAMQNLRLPERFLRLKEEQQAGAHGGIAAGRCLAAAGRAGRMGGALSWQRHPQPGRLPVRHHPAGHPWRVQCLGQASWVGTATSRHARCAT